ncbi:isochorismatase family cysteine hydrolase [Sorangium sp. So ce429]
MSFFSLANNIQPKKRPSNKRLLPTSLRSAAEPQSFDGKSAQPVLPSVARRLLSLPGGVTAMSTTALILIDMQNDFLHGNGVFPRRHVDAHQLANAVRLLDQAAASQGWEVSWVQSCYGDLPVPVAGQTHTGAPCCRRGEWGMAFFEPIQALVKNVQLKMWYSAFRETGLHESLQARGVSHLIVCGVATNVCVSLTSRDALALGYTVEVVEDATAAGTLAKHLSALKALGEAGAAIVSCGDLLTRGRLRLGGFGEGSTLYCGFLGDVLGEDAFEELHREIGWQTNVSPGGEVPRRVALQGILGPSGEEPLYRHRPTSSPPWCPGPPRPAPKRSKRPSACSACSGRRTRTPCSTWPVTFPGSGS